MPQIPQNKQPKLNFQINSMIKKDCLRAVKIEELGLKKPIFSSNPTNPANLMIRGLPLKSSVSLMITDQRAPERFKDEVNFSIGNTTKIYHKSMSVSVLSQKERIVNHKYKNVLIEDFFRYFRQNFKEHLTLLYFDIEPDIINPNNLIKVNYVNNIDSDFINQTYQRNKKSI